VINLEKGVPFLIMKKSIDFIACIMALLMLISLFSACTPNDERHGSENKSEGESESVSETLGITETGGESYSEDRETESETETEIERISLINGSIQSL
jgi:hypothetical protein